MRKFLWAYYKWGHDERGPYAKITMEKYTKKLFYGYEKFSGKYVKVQNHPIATDITLIKRELGDPMGIHKHRSFVGKIMCYTTKLVHDVENINRISCTH